MKRTFFYVLGTGILSICLATAIVFVSNHKKTDCQTTVTERVLNNIKAGLNIPRSFQLIKAEQPDSAFGVFWFPQEELDVMQSTILDFSISLLDKVSDIWCIDDTLSSLKSENLSYLKVYSIAIQKASMVLGEYREKASFSGWRVKIIYSFADGDGKQYTLTRWTFLDSDGENIQGILEIPGEVYFPTRESKDDYITDNKLFGYELQGTKSRETDR